MKAAEIINLLNEWAPLYLIDEWDNTGFQIGDSKREVKRILISLDLDREVFEKALREDVQMIVTHHPIIFKPLKTLVRDNYKEKLIYDIIKEDIVVYNAHTNLDVAKNGVNETLARVLDIKDTEPLKTTYEEPLYKIVVFVPNSHRDLIIKTLGNEGAGWVGNYSHCTYNVEGVGTFMPREGTNPFIGETNILEKVEETRIETIVEKKDLQRILDKMIKVHPYEEVAYDIYPLANKGKSLGDGRVGEIEKVSLSQYLDKVKKSLNVDNIIVYGDRDRIINRVAVCGGSGSSFIYDAYLREAQVYITGDIKYHDAQYANELGLTIIDAGHYHTEKVILPVIKEYLEEKTQKMVEVQLYNQSSPPYVIY